MAYADLGPIETWEAVEAHPSVSLTGSPTTAWEDDSSASYASQSVQPVAGQIPDGYPCVPLPNLPMTPQDAAAVAEVSVTWTAWYTGDMPGNNPDLEQVFVLPILCRGRAEDYGHNLAPRSTQSWDQASILLSPEPKTFTRILISDGGGAGSWKSNAEVLSDPTIYVPPDSLDPTEYFLQMRTYRQLTDRYDPETNEFLGSNIVTHVSEVTINFGEEGPAPITLDPASTSVSAHWAGTGTPTEVVIGDPIEWPDAPVLTSEEPDAHTFTGLEPETTYLVGARFATPEGPSGWVTAQTTTLAEEATPGARPHYQRSLRDATGLLRTGAQVSLFERGTENPVVQTVYLDAQGENERGTTWLCEDGVVDFYLAQAQVVDILVEMPGDEPVLFEEQWVGPVGGSAPGGGGGGGGGGVGTTITEIVHLSTDEYDALPEWNPSTLYITYPSGGGAN